MTGVFIELGLLVLAAFALGLLVGWLAWGAGHQVASDQVVKRGNRRQRTHEPPEWQGQPRPAVEDPSTGVSPKPTVSSTDSEQTVIIGGGTEQRVLDPIDAPDSGSSA